MISREDLHKVIEGVPDNKLHELFNHAKRLSNERKIFEDAFNSTLKKYNKSFENLVQR